MNKAEYFTQHALDWMVNVREKMCRTEGCGTQASFGVAGTKTAEYCTQLALDGRINVKKRTCRTEGCGKNAAFGVEGTKTPEYCRHHALSGMVNVRDVMCKLEGCGKIPAFGVAGTKTKEYYRQHALDGMVNVRGKMCGTEGCGKQPSFGEAGTRTAEYCTQHALDGMVNVHRKVRTEDSSMISAFKVANMKTDEHCAQHNRLRRNDPNLSGKEINGAACPSGSKHQTVHTPPAQASPFSGSSRGSRKRVRYLHTGSTVLKKRAVALETTAGALTMPEIEGQKSPVKQDSSVKTEVHASL